MDERRIKVMKKNKIQSGNKRERLRKQRRDNGKIKKIKKYEKKQRKLSRKEEENCSCFLADQSSYFVLE